MCGITGVLSASAVDPARVERMRDSLAHRGPDSTGLWTSPDGRACLAHRRLAVIDPTPRSGQPLVSDDGRHVVVLNGEIYNFRELRRDLEATGARFATTSDTEVLLGAYRAWGAGCLPRLSGMFAFAVWDAAAGTLFCARDRTGEKPFYWSVVGDTFLFGSELKSLLDWPGFRRELDGHALAEFLHFGFVADPRSIWRGVSKLPPGHSMTVRLGARGLDVGAPSRYWNMTFAPDHRVRDWSPEILDTLSRAVREMSVADVPLGTLLSGGVDSSAVTAALAREGSRVTAFTIGFEDDREDDRPWARQVAAQYGLAHRVHELSPDDMLREHDLLWHYDEPFNDTSSLPTYRVCEQARRELTVVLTGDGADELFAGYRRYKYLATRQFKYGWVPSGAARAASGIASAVLPRRSGVRRRLARFAADRTTLFADMLSIGHDAAALRAAARGPLAAALAEYSPHDTIRAFLDELPEDVGLVDAMRYLDLKLTLAGGMLVKVDRASMAVALEVRAVFLHRDMLELAGRIPAERLVVNGEPKHALKAALKAWLPEPLLFRRKRGFSAPLGQWRRAGSWPAGAPARASRLDGLLDPAFLERLTTRHAAGGADLSRAIGSIELLDGWLGRWN